MSMIAKFCEAHFEAVFLIHFLSIIIQSNENEGRLKAEKNNDSTIDIL